jgi:hypothetical protein
VTEIVTTVEATMEDFLRAASIHTGKALDPATPREEFATHCALGHAYSLVAYLLDAHLQTGDDTTELAWELHEFAEDGEPLAHWVGDQVRARGINTDEPAQS